MPLENDGWPQVHARNAFLRVAAGQAERGVPHFASWIAGQTGQGKPYADPAQVVAALVARRRRVLEAQLDDRLSRQDPDRAMAGALLAAESAWPGVAALAASWSDQAEVGHEQRTLTRHETLAFELAGTEPAPRRAASSAPA